MNLSRVRVVGFGVLALTAVVFFVGCTPEEQQAARDAVNTTFQNTASLAIGFILDFGRQALAAFLF